METYAARSLFLLAGQTYPSRTRRLHVLLVEDDQSIASMYRAQLEHDGYQVAIAQTGRAGVDLALKTRPDLILLDILLSDWTGFDFMFEVNQDPGHPPIVILSNYGDPQMIDRGLSLGAIEYLVKSRVDPIMVSRRIPGWVEMAQRGGPDPNV